MKAVIFAAGKSTRTHPLTLTRPKPLLPIANKTILQHQLVALRGIVDGVILVVGYRSEMIRERFGVSWNGLSITYVEQREQKGSGHALSLCEGVAGDSFLAMNGDDLYAAEDLATLAEAEQAALAKEVADPRPFGVYETDSNGNAIRIVEKPTDIFSNLANIGAYKFTAGIFDTLRSVEPSARGEIEIPSAIQELASRGRFRLLTAKGYWLPIVYPWHILDANEFLLSLLEDGEIAGDVHAAAHLTGPVIVGQGTVLKPGVVIEGPVVIGENCTIGPNCWLRAYTAIGDRCKVGHAVEIRNSILMNGARVPRLSYVGDSILGENCNLGCGTVVSNFRHDGGNHLSMVKGELVDTGRRKFGTVIGDGVHTGINTSIYPGRKLWPGTSTRPGEVVQRDIEG